MKERSKGVVAGPKERLIEAAGEIFGERGYQSATAREITTKAEVNLAAINYHFRDKEELYWEILRIAVHATLRNDKVIDESLPAEKQLGTFVSDLLHHLLDPRRPQWHAKVIARELAAPSRLLNVMVESGIRPKADILRRIVRRLTEAELSPERESLLCAGIMGQCLYYRQYGPIAAQLYPELFEGPDLVGKLADHITEATIASIDCLRKKAARRPRSQAAA